MTDIDTKELRRLMEAKRAADREYSAAWGNLNAFTQEEISGITARMFEAWEEFSRSAIEALPALLSEAEEAARLRELVCRVIPLIKMEREALFAGHSCGGRLVVEDEADELARDDIARIDAWLHDARALTTGGDDDRT